VHLPVDQPSRCAFLRDAAALAVAAPESRRSWTCTATAGTATACVAFGTRKSPVGPTIPLIGWALNGF
jgi:hypothetical protein